MTPNASTAADERPMRSHAWVIAGDHPVSNIEVNVPGVVFVDYDSDLGKDLDDSQQPTASETLEMPASDDTKRDVARVVITSDSQELLDGLIVEPLTTGSEPGGLRVRVKNTEAELKGSIMTQVYVNTKNAVRMVDNAAATTVIRDDVLVHDDPATDVTLSVSRAGKLLVWCNEGFSLGSLWGFTHDGGSLEFSAPFIVAQNTISISSMWNGSKADVIADFISAKEVSAFAIKATDVVVHTTRLVADRCFNGAAISSSSRINGNGTAKEQGAFAFWSSSVSSPGIVTARTDAGVGFTGSVLAHPVKHLEASNIGAGSIEYAGPEPKIVRIDGRTPWLSKQKSSVEPVVKPATPARLADAAKPRELQDSPLREPMAIHMRVKKSKTPKLQNLEGSSYRAKVIADALPTVGVLAVVPESDRVSADQQFAKTWEVRSRSLYSLRSFRIDIPGRVFFSHIDNTSSDADAEAGDVFSRIKVSGSSAQTVELVDIQFPLVTYSSEEVLKLAMMGEAPATDAVLLVEVQLLRKNALKFVTLSGHHNCDVVLLENVLYSSDRDPFLTAENYLPTNRVTLTVEGGNNSMFVSDKSGAVTMDTLDITLYGTGNIQVELAALKTNSSFDVSAGGSGDVRVFVDDLRADVDISVGYKSAKGNVCISPPAVNNVNVTRFSGPETQASYPGKESNTFPCEKLALPRRVPVSRQSGVASSTPASTPSATSSASSLNGALLLLLTTSSVVVLSSMLLALS